MGRSESTRFTKRKTVNRRLAVFTGLLGTGCSGVGLGGFVAGKWGLLAIFGPLAVFYGWGTWMLSPRPVAETKVRKHYERQNAFFKRLRIKWLIGPDWPENDRDRI